MRRAACTRQLEIFRTFNCLERRAVQRTTRTRAVRREQVGSRAKETSATWCALLRARAIENSVSRGCQRFLALGPPGGAALADASAQHLPLATRARTSVRSRARDGVSAQGWKLGCPAGRAVRRL